MDYNYLKIKKNMMCFSSLFNQTMASPLSTKAVDNFVCKKKF